MLGIFPRARGRAIDKTARRHARGCRGAPRAPAIRMMRRTSIEYDGLGQSGYTAGRRLPDPALERQLEIRYVGYPRGVDGEAVLKDELCTDDRWTGRGCLIVRDTRG